MTNLPLRPDGGIDWEKYSPDPKIRDHYRQFAAATLERVAKWHDDEYVRWKELGLINLNKGKDDEARHCAQIYITHEASAASIREMKP